MRIQPFSAFVCAVSLCIAAGAQTPAPAGVRFEITADAQVVPKPVSGRMFVIVGRNADREPRLSMDETGVDASPMLGRDVKGFAATDRAVIDDRAVIFPIPHLVKLTAGEYFVQAVFDTNIDLRSSNAPGNLYSDVVKTAIDPAKPSTIALRLTHRVPDETLPADTDVVRYLKIESKLLSAFHGRRIFLRAGVLLPPGWATEPSRKYPLRVHIGGYGSRFTNIPGLGSENSEFGKAWRDPATPRMILLHLDGDGPLGDPYQVNSANHGPYGDALTQELIPYVERTFRGIGEPRARVLDGGSTGGWVSLALQVFYPDFFNGAWSYCPDGVDFRAFQLVNIYADDNAYVNKNGFERPSARDLNGDVRFTMRHECQLENVIGAGDSWTMSGMQWGAWNATYGPRGADGRPAPLWDPVSGKIDKTVVDHWKKYDIRLILEQNWATLGPKLNGKIHIWVGEADNYFLNNAVHLLEESLKKATPPYEWSIRYGPGKGHCWQGLTEREIIDQMAARTGKIRQE